jgi:hypothetical protein
MFPQRETAHVFPSSEGLWVCFCGCKFIKVNNIRNVILKNLRASRASCFECYFVLKAIFSFALMQKKQKIKPQYFYPKNHRTYFPIATPAARVSHSTQGALTAAKAEIFTVIFWLKNIRATKASCCYLKIIFFVFTLFSTGFDLLKN